MKANDVAANLAQLSRELVELLRDYESYNQQARRYMVTYKRDYAEAFLKAEGPLEVRKQQATRDTINALLDSELAEAQFDNVRASLRVLGQRLDAGRTLASTIRAEAIASGSAE